MQLMHKTQDGRQLPISSMEDSHLENTINLLCRRVEECKKGLNSTVAFTPMQQALYDIDYSVIAKCSAETIRSLHTGLIPYVFEAAIRNIDVTPQLQEAFERTAKEDVVPIIKSGRLLSGANDDDYEDWQDDEM